MQSGKLTNKTFFSKKVPLFQTDFIETVFPTETTIGNVSMKMLIEYFSRYFIIFFRIIQRYSLQKN